MGLPLMVVDPVGGGSFRAAASSGKGGSRVACASVGAGVSPPGAWFAADSFGSCGTCVVPGDGVLDAGEELDGATRSAWSDATPTASVRSVSPPHAPSAPRESPSARAAAEGIRPLGAEQNGHAVSRVRIS